MPTSNASSRPSCGQCSEVTAKPLSLSPRLAKLPAHAIRAGRSGCAPRLRDLRFRLEYAALRGVVALMRLMPLRLSVRWSATLWRILAPRLNPKRQRIALENLRIAFPDKGEQERLAICTAHWENLGRVVAEMVQIDRLLSDPSRIEIPDQRLLARYHDKLGPVIGVSLHLGTGNSRSGLSWSPAPTPRLSIEPSAIPISIAI